MAYALLPSDLMDPSIKELSVIMVKEGETGYWLTDWKWGREHAEECLREKNQRLGLTEEEATKLVIASFGKLLP